MLRAGRKKSCICDTFALQANLSRMCYFAQRKSEGVVQRCSLKKDVLRNFAKFTGKHLCQSVFFKKVAKKENLAQVFSCEFCEVFKNTFSYRTPPVAAFVTSNDIR